MNKKISSQRQYLVCVFYAYIYINIKEFNYLLDIREKLSIHACISSLIVRAIIGKNKLNFSSIWEEKLKVIEFE